MKPGRACRARTSFSRRRDDMARIASPLVCRWGACRTGLVEWVPRAALANVAHVVWLEAWGHSKRVNRADRPWRGMAPPGAISQL